MHVPVRAAALQDVLSGVVHAVAEVKIGGNLLCLSSLSFSVDP